MKRIKIKKCRSCKNAPWVCRDCNNRICEHFCTFKKNDGTATCSSCTGKKVIKAAHSIEKKESWKQDIPRQQLTVLAQSAWGNIHNMLNSIIRIKDEDYQRLKTALNNIEEIQKILNQMNDNDIWVTKECNCSKCVKKLAKFNTPKPSTKSSPKGIDVHTEHCCKKCGCAYGDDQEINFEDGESVIPCSVVSGRLKQSLPCGTANTCHPW